MTKEQEDERNQLIAANEYIPSSEFLNIHRYPTLHLIKAIPNPVQMVFTDINTQISNLSIEDASEARMKLFTCIKDICFQDELTAKYMFLNLIQRITSRIDGIPIGSFNINIYSKEEDIIKFVAENITRLSTGINTHTMYHSITIPSLKDVSLIPKKNHETNKLEYGKF